MKKEKPVVVALFGRICSGKTTLAKKFEKDYCFEVVSKDRCILTSELLARENNKVISWEEVRQNLVKDIIQIKKNTVIDETIRIDRLSAFKNAGYTIIGVKLNCDIEKCKKRLQIRNERRQEILAELSNIINIDVTVMPQDQRRCLWKNRDFVNKIPLSQKEQFDKLIEEIYTLGCDYLKEENPNPACFKELDYIIELDSNYNFEYLDWNTLLNNKVSYNEYLRKYLLSIKYCIWDIGGVIYKFSLEPLNEWCSRKANNIINIKSFDFDEYMLGTISFEQLCQNICRYCNIKYLPQYNIEIKKAFWEGVSDDFETTHCLMQNIKSKGIENCILSNALPILLESGKYQEFIKNKYRFYSFDLHLLKPDNNIYIKVKNNLKCEFHDMAFIDDKEENVNAALELGIYAILYDSNIRNNPLFKI